MAKPAGKSAAARVALLFFVVLSSSGCATRLTSSEKMMWSTYAIATSKGMATCVVINRKDSSAPHGVVPVIITSAHVLSVAPHGPFYLVIRNPRIGSSPQVGILEFQAPDSRDRPFVRHPRHYVAALELRIPPEFADDIFLTSFIDEKSIARRGDEPHAGDEISVLGFPRVFPGTAGAFPVLRAAKVASYSAGPPSDREKFLINTHVYGGDSGGPVFAGRRSGRPRLIGMVVERIGGKGGGIPLAVAVDAQVIRQTLQLQAKQEHWYLESGSNVPPPPGKSRPRRAVQLVGPSEAFR